MPTARAAIETCDICDDCCFSVPVIRWSSNAPHAPCALASTSHATLRRFSCRRAPPLHSTFGAPREHCARELAQIEHEPRVLTVELSSPRMTDDPDRPDPVIAVVHRDQQ